MNTLISMGCKNITCLGPSGRLPDIVIQVGFIRMGDQTWQVV